MGKIKIRVILVFLSFLFSYTINATETKYPDILTSASFNSELEKIRTGDQLARFIYKKELQDDNLSELLNGIHNSGRLRIPDYEVEIPIREIYGTIITEKFIAGADEDFWQDKHYAVREICAFVDSDDNVCRYHITVFKVRQYKLMEQVLLKEIKDK